MVILNTVILFLKNIFAYSFLSGSSLVYITEFSGKKRFNKIFIKHIVRNAFLCSVVHFWKN
jgi:hypothetical protein